MQQLSFPAYDFRFKSRENTIYIFDIVRKKFVVLQPEEWVRQHVVHHLILEKLFPKSLISVERQLIINGIKKRYDIVVYKRDGGIHILVECKAPEIRITQQTFDQIARYNMELRADYLMVTNGMSHFYCKMDFTGQKYHFLEHIPDFSR